MTIDERIEALTMNLELLSRDLESFRDTSRETMAQLAHQVARGSQQLAQVVQQVAQLVTVVTTDAENIRALARIAEIHERRLTDLEEGPES